MTPNYAVLRLTLKVITVFIKSRKLDRGLKNKAKLQQVQRRKLSNEMHLSSLKKKLNPRHPTQVHKRQALDNPSGAEFYK